MTTAKDVQDSMPHERLPTSASFSPRAHSESYLSELLSYSLDRLNKEPDLLKQDSEQKKRQIVEAAVVHYEAALSAEECFQGLRSTVDDLNQALDEKTLPDFIDRCRSFASGSEIIAEKRHQSKALWHHREAVSTLLEIPKLMETCVRNGNVDEALDLRSFVHRLHVLHSNLSAVRGLNDAAAEIRDTILDHLKFKLASDIQLPECLSVVGHLRRLGIYTERELRTCFLECRERWIVGLIEDLDKRPVFEFLKRLTDVHRLHLFNVAMQYKAIFSTETEGDGGRLAEWSLHRITDYLTTLEASLIDITDGVSLVSLLESVMYGGMSLGRVGLDFRSLLIRPFEQRILEIFRSRIEDAVRSFVLHIDGHKWNSNEDDSNGTVEEDGPPSVLSKHLPIALFLNGILSALNELRHCAPVRGRSFVEFQISEAVKKLDGKIVQLSVRSFDPSQKKVFLSACRDMVTVLMPYLLICLQSIYPNGKLDVTFEIKGINGY